MVDRCSWTLRPWNRSLADVASSKERRRGHVADLAIERRIGVYREQQQLRGHDQERGLWGFRGIWAAMAHMQRKPINIRAVGHHMWHHAQRGLAEFAIVCRVQYPGDFVVVCTTIENAHLSCSSIVRTTVSVRQKCIDEDEKHVY